MLRHVRVAVEPELRPGHTAPGEGLLYEGPGHQGHLVQEHPGEGDALDEHIGALVPASEDVEAVRSPAPGHGEDVLRPGVAQREVLLQVANGEKRLDDVPLRTAHRLAAEGEALPVKGSHGPEEEAQAHDAGLPGADRAVADEGPFAGVGPLKDRDLFWREHGPPPSGSG